MSKIKLKEVAKVITKGTTPSSVGKEFKSFGIKFVKSESINGAKFLNKSLFAFIDEETDEKLKRSRLQEDDLLFSIAGAYLGKIAIVRKDDVPSNTNQAVGIVRLDKKKVDVNYLYYFFSQKSINENINKLSSQSSQPNLNLDLLGNLEYDNKLLPTQKKIASVLSALDDKIELNNEINAELEQMTKIIYDYWFVQFDFPDPNGKPYKSSGGKMVWNDQLKREVPEGWEIKKIEEIANIVDCLHSKKPDYFFEDESIYLLQLENILDNGLIDTSNKYYVNKVDYQNWTSRIEVKEHDILITNAGRVAATAQVSNETISGIGRNITAIRPLHICPTYFFLSFRGYDIERQIKSNIDQGAFFTSFNVKGIKQLYFLLPPKKIEYLFEKKAYSFRRLREVNLKQNQHLSQLRDWLLPMLMNGQVTVGEAYEKMEEVLSVAAENGVSYKKN